MIPLASLTGLPKWAYALAGAVLLAGAFLIWNRFDNKAAIEADRRAVEAETAKLTLEAERAANRADAARQAEIEAGDAKTRKAIDDAVERNPDAARRPAGAAVRAAAGSLHD